MTPDEWLVREKNGMISGPFSAETLRKMILSGDLVVQSEICVANGYWVSLHEADEVERLLGVQVPVQLSQVEANFHEEKTDPLDAVQLQSLDQGAVPDSTALLTRAGERLSVTVPIADRGTEGGENGEEKKNYSLLLLGFLLIALGLLGALYYFRTIH